MQAFELALTLAILLSAVAWAVRKALRWAGRRARGEPPDCAPGCGSANEGCGSCPLGGLQTLDEPPDRPVAEEDET